MPVYHGDKPQHFDAALGSMCEQSYPAREILVVVDGPIPDALSKVLDKWSQQYPSLRQVRLPENRGLSAALNAGIAEAQYGWIARMDADDIARPYRLQKQVDYILRHSQLDLLGSWIDEYNEDMDEKLSTRKLPEEHELIRQYARWRCPFNHMTVMYRTAAVRKLGMYKDYGAVGDDYELWARFLVNGYRVANLPEVLVDARTGQDFFSKRRRGLKYLKNEVREVNELHKLGLINQGQRLVHIGVKSALRLAPPFLLRGFYKLLRLTS